MTDSTDTSPASTPAITQEFWISKHAHGADQHIEPATAASDASQGAGDPIKEPADKSDQPKDNAIPQRSHITRLLHVDYIARIESRLSNSGSIALVFTSHDEHDHIQVHTLNEHLVVDINEHRYHLTDFLSTETLVLRSGAGNDQIDINHAVSNPVIIESGEGADAVQTGAGPARVYTGPGDDEIFTRSGDSYIEAGDGDDHIQTHGTTSVYGGKGNDHIASFAANSFISGGEGNDSIIGSHGHNILSGGEGEDLIMVNGSIPSTVYTGTGGDFIMNTKPEDVIFANSSSMLLSTEGEQIEGRQTLAIDPDDVASSPVLAIGSPAFRERVNDDLHLLRSSATGQKLLHALSSAAHPGTRVFIKELSEGQGGEFTPYDYPSETAEPSPDLRPTLFNGQPGSGVPAGTLYYNPSFMQGATPAIVQLYHGLCHAYNYLTGTIFPGESLDGIDGDKPRAMIANAELQAIGLPVEATPFDFDNDPATPPLNSNPEPFTENAIRQEFGLSPRKQSAP